jgi:hypothetical protein
VRLVHHSDAGSQYTSYAFGQVLDDHGVLASIGSVGDAFDNALAESFVDSCKTELIADRVWATRAQLEFAIVEYVRLRKARAGGAFRVLRYARAKACPRSLVRFGSCSAPVKPASGHVYRVDRKRGPCWLVGFVCHPFPWLTAR